MSEVPLYLLLRASCSSEMGGFSIPTKRIALEYAAAAGAYEGFLNSALPVSFNFVAISSVFWSRAIFPGFT